MADSERLQIPGWVKPAAVLVVALFGAGVSAANFANAYDAKMTALATANDRRLDRIETKVDALRSEVCSQRRALKLDGWSPACEGLVTPAAFGLAQDTPEDREGFVNPGTIIGIIAGAGVGLILLGLGISLLCWTEVVRLRKRQHQTDNDMTAVFLKLDLPKGKR